MKNIYELKNIDIDLKETAIAIVGQDEVLNIDANTEASDLLKEIKNHISQLVEAAKENQKEYDYDWIVGSIKSWEIFLKVHFIDYSEIEIPVFSKEQISTEKQLEMAVERPSDIQEAKKPQQILKPLLITNEAPDIKPLLQSQHRRLANTFLDQATWLPDEGRKAIETWVEAYKTNRINLTVNSKSYHYGGDKTDSAENLAQMSAKIEITANAKYFPDFVEEIIQLVIEKGEHITIKAADYLHKDLERFERIDPKKISIKLKS